MEQKKLQVMRYSDDELKILNSAFSERTDLLLLLRKFLLQGELNEVETESIKLFKTSNILPIIQKTYLPVLDLDTPLGQLMDFWMLVDTKDRSLEHIKVELYARQGLIDYMNQRFKCLINGQEDDRDIKLKSLGYSKDKEVQKSYAELAARNINATPLKKAS